MARILWRPSIRTLIATVVVTPIVIVSAILVTLSWTSSVRISESLANNAMSAAAKSVAGEVRDYLGAAVQVGDRYTRRVESGVLPDPPGQAWERAFLDELATSPAVASICYGNTGGDATWLLRHGERLELGRALEARENGAVEYTVDPETGRLLGPPLRTYTYDPRQRPWWTIALASDKPTWTPVYSWFAGNTAEAAIGTGYTRQIRRPDGTLKGVLVVDVTLGAMNDFLRRLDIAKLGRVFIVDEQDRLIASSYSRVIDGTGNLTVAALATEHVLIDGSPARVRIAELNPYPGIRWRVVAMMPESAFMADAQRVMHRTIIAGIAATFASLFLGFLLSRYLSRPLLRIAGHVQRVGAGDFDSRLDLSATRELRRLSDEINRMTSGLRQRMTLEQSLAVAMEVQQSLLPESDPEFPTLDIAGRSKYCDATGGDYFDFIDVAKLSRSSVLVAVGDVMGHGIAAALLMATARAALHSVIHEKPTLGMLMSRINQVLAADNRHNRFMTLALLEIGDEAGEVRWASAGHDPALVYESATETFRELEGADVPLGIIADVNYQEYTGASLKPGDILIIGTDGIWEMHNPKMEQYGKDRLRAVIRLHHASDAREIAKTLEADLQAFGGTRPPDDDVTFVIVRRR